MGTIDHGDRLMLRIWLIDHGADWASRAGDFVSRPFTALEAYCNREWWKFTPQERKDYTKKFIGP